MAIFLLTKIEIYPPVCAMLKNGFPAFQHVILLHSQIIVVLHIHGDVFHGVVYLSAFLRRKLPVAVTVPNENIQVIVAMGVPPCALLIREWSLMNKRVPKHLIAPLSVCRLD